MTSVLKFSLKGSLYQLEGQVKAIYCLEKRNRKTRAYPVLVSFLYKECWFFDNYTLRSQTRTKIVIELQANVFKKC